MQNIPNRPQSEQYIPQDNTFQFEPQRKNIFKKIVFAVAVVLLLVLALTSFFLLQHDKIFVIEQTSQTKLPSSIPDNTWKTYSDKDLGFTVSYPENFEVNTFTLDSSNNGTSYGVSFGPRPVDINIEYWPIVSISVEDNLSRLAADQYIKQFVFACSSPGVCPTPTGITNIVVAGIDAIKVENPPAPIPSQLVVVMQNSKIYRIEQSLDAYLENQYTVERKKELFSSMLNSFKFVTSPSSEITLEDIMFELPVNSYEMKTSGDQEWGISGYCKYSGDKWYTPNQECQLLEITDPQGNKLFVSSPAQFGILISDAQECFKENTEVVSIGQHSFKITSNYHNLEQIIYEPNLIDQGESPYNCSKVEYTQSNFHHLKGCQGNVCFWAQKPFDLIKFNEWLQSVN